MMDSMPTFETVFEYEHESGRVVSVVVNPLDPDRHHLRLVYVEPNMMIIVPQGAWNRKDNKLLPTVRTMVDQVVAQL